jgi:hypothetical protein
MVDMAGSQVPVMGFNGGHGWDVSEKRKERWGVGYWVVDLKGTNEKKKKWANNLFACSRDEIN